MTAGSSIVAMSCIRPAQNVTLACDGAVATLNRPERRNSLSDAMLTDLGTVLAEVKASINAIASNGIPVINAMTEGFLDRA